MYKFSLQPRMSFRPWFSYWKTVWCRHPYVENPMGLPERTNDAAGAYAKACVSAAEECGVPVVDLWTKMQQLPDWKNVYLRYCMITLFMHWLIACLNLPHKIVSKFMWLSKIIPWNLSNSRSTCINEHVNTDGNIGLSFSRDDFSNMYDEIVHIGGSLFYCLYLIMTIQAIVVSV